MKQDKYGNWINEEFPPKGDTRKRYDGYDTWNEDMLFKVFAIDKYDMWFSYKGKKYFFNNDLDVSWVSEDWNEEYETWPSPNDFIRNFKLDGKPLYEMVNKLDEIDWI